MWQPNATKRPGRQWATVCASTHACRKRTCIEYNTTELLIRRLLSEGLQDVTHVVIDESHERSLFVDLLLLLLKLKLLEKNPENVKIIVMSATIHVNAFAEYFRSVCSVGVVEIPCGDLPREC